MRHFKGQDYVLKHIFSNIIYFIRILDFEIHQSIDVKIEDH